MKRRAGTKPTSFDAIQFKTLYLDLLGGGSATAPVLVTPATPTELDATTVSSASIYLEWSSTGENTTNYLIESSPDGVTYTQIATVPVGITVYTDTGLSPATLYYYRVRASSASNYSPYSNVASATTLTMTPQNLTATTVDDSHIDLAWELDDPTGATATLIERGTDGVNFVQIDSVDELTLVYNDSGLSGYTPYYYRVRTTDGVTYSGYSNIATATTDFAPGTVTAEAIACYAHSGDASFVGDYGFTYSSASYTSHRGIWKIVTGSGLGNGRLRVTVNVTSYSGPPKISLDTDITGGVALYPSANFSGAVYEFDPPAHAVTSGINVLYDASFYPSQPFYTTGYFAIGIRRASSSAAVDFDITLIEWVLTAGGSVTLWSA